jgi:hypothetical protein
MDCIETARPFSHILMGEQQLTDGSPAHIEGLGPLPHQLDLAGRSGSLAFRYARSMTAQASSACRNCPRCNKNHLVPTAAHGFNLVSEMPDNIGMKSILI